MKQPRICVIIATHNLHRKLKKCLSALAGTKYRNLNIVIIDNHSNPMITNVISSDQIIPFVKMDIIRKNSNVGFAQANNEALELALKRYNDTDYFLLLNNDAYVGKNFFRDVLPYLDGRGDLISPVVLLTGGRGVDSMGIDYYRDGTGINRISKSNYKFLLPAACLFVKKKFAQNSFSKFGWFFIPQFGSYVEDIELSLRALLSGRKLILMEKVQVHHDRSSTISSDEDRLYLGLRNLLWTIVTTWTPSMIKSNISELIQGQLINFVVYSMKVNLFMMINIYIDTACNLLMLIHLRKKIQSNIRFDNVQNLLLPQLMGVRKHILRSRTYRKITNSLRI